MSTAAQRRAIKNYRERLARRGIERIEAAALETDRSLIRALGGKLVEDGPKAERLRAAVKALIADEPPMRGGILAALRRSPLVGADIDLSRPGIEGRRIDL